MPYALPSTLSYFPFPEFSFIRVSFRIRLSSSLASRGRLLAVSSVSLVPPLARRTYIPITHAENPYRTSDDHDGSSILGSSLLYVGIKTMPTVHIIQWEDPCLVSSRGICDFHHDVSSPPTPRRRLWGGPVKSYEDITTLPRKTRYSSSIEIQTTPIAVWRCPLWLIAVAS
jgi:hypothetical protein